MSDDQKNMLLDWMRKIHQLEYAHRFESLEWAKTQYRIGLFAFSFSLFIAFSFRFPEVNLETYNNLWWIAKHDNFVAFGSFLVALASGYLTFTKPSEKSEIHKSTGSNYEKLRHEIEMLLTFSGTENVLKKRTAQIKAEWDNLDAINVKEKHFVTAKDKVKKFNKYPEELGFLPTI